MQVFNSIHAWREFRKSLNAHSIGFVPTMGNLHAGHESLIAQAKAQNQCTVLSIFINPTQFNDKNDFNHYPKTLDQDLALAQKMEVDCVLVPSTEEMYPDFHYQVKENCISTILEGKYRPGHFEGMLTVVLKLLMLIRPQKAYFGEKDFQQLKLVQGLVKTFFIDTQIVPCQTIRHTNGLAMSSRNTRLSLKGFEQASMLHDALKHCQHEEDAKAHLAQSGFLVEYLEKWEGRRLAAVNIEGVRLIDNEPI
ncbi:MAG: pantoate--beta-alanine ligase [Candidatus Berkiella sp.]